jgi:hypothetical protein
MASAGARDVAGSGIYLDHTGGTGCSSKPGRFAGAPDAVTGHTACIGAAVDGRGVALGGPNIQLTKSDARLASASIWR